MRKEALPPVLGANPQEELLSLRCEGVSIVEGLYQGYLSRLKQEGYHLLYLCAPLRATEETLSGWWNIQKALTAASQILDARWGGKNTSLWIPHLHGLSFFNELHFPAARDKAFKFNQYLLRNKVFDTLVIAGNLISEGVQSEIEIANSLGLEVVPIAQFMREAKKLPSMEKAFDYYEALLALFESNLHNFFVP